MFNNKVLQVRCSRCDKKVILLCPHCLKGSLVCDDKTLVLTCNNCNALVKNVSCANHHCIGSGYIMKKQKMLDLLQKHSDIHGIKVVLGAFIMCACLVGILLA